MPIELDPQALDIAISSPRWSVIARTGLGVDDFATWDPKIIRKPRLIVPIDVQALYVEEGSTEAFVRLPGAVSTPDGEPPEPTPAPLDPGAPRPSGVHLHWAMPDAVMNGQMQDVDGDGLGLAALPNRWLVLRLLAPDRAERMAVTGWVIEADTTRVIPLKDWKEETDQGLSPTGKTLKGRDLNAGAGGSLAWTASYDATFNRFAFHDPLNDITEAAPNGVFGDVATYLIAGWWSRAAEDPLDAARTASGFASVTEDLGWRVNSDTGGQTAVTEQAMLYQAELTNFGVESATRFSLVDTGSLASSTALSGAQGAEVFLPEGGRFVAVEPKHIYSTLLNGIVHGVPVTGPVPADQRPDPRRVRAALGPQVEDSIAALTAAAMEGDDLDARAETERLIAALTNDQVAKLGERNGAVEIEEREHAARFEAERGRDYSIEKIIDRGGPENLIAGRAARNRAGNTERQETERTLATELTWSATKPGVVSVVPDHLGFTSNYFERDGRAQAEPKVRSVRRPGPRYFRALEPVVAIRDAKRSRRHQEDGVASPDGTLTCRWPSQIPIVIPGGISGRQHLGPFPHGALPDEVVRLAQNAVITDPFTTPWLAEQAAPTSPFPQSVLAARLRGEVALRYSRDGLYDGTVPGFSAPTRTGEASVPGPMEAALGDQLRRHSLLDGVDAAPLGVTVWAQPWSPIWLEWEVELDLTDRLTGWALGQVDYDAAPPPGGSTRVVSGRSPINNGAAESLTATVTNWMTAEDLRDIDDEGQLDEDGEKEVRAVYKHLTNADVISATLSGIHEALLGLPEAPDGQVEQPDTKIAPIDLPQLLFSGRIRINTARLVDAFGRVLDVEPGRVVHPAALVQPGPWLELPPRLTRPARIAFRLADPADGAALPREATINQERPDLMVNPVAGFLLPDLIDEALEVFDAAGTPLGQLQHEPIGGGVVWEIAPGREGPADAGPLFDLRPAAQPLGRFAAAMIEADARTRGGTALSAKRETALSAFLRAVDTTLWSIDTFASLGTPHIAGLVGRPMAVVRATIRMQIYDDLDLLDLSAPGARDARKAVYDDLADRAFHARLGEFTRDDDGVYGYFINDDYRRFHVVDKIVKTRALESGRRRGQFASLGASRIPAPDPIDHPYLVGEDEFPIHLGEVIRLTILMHPAGKVHLTSGIVPRKSLQLARDWVDPGLGRMAPSARIGPVLIDPDKVRLPKIASFGEDQIWTRRDTPFSWKDDPILAATQAALLPDAPAAIEEGYVRIATAPIPGNEEES
ncbi:hypothetical protein SAMN05444851_1546 [Aliiroseovarius sediminilitoris]|uniref:Uncharacterized protein n=1 Tax=Aliiroseovarius sediminilitoris TaxID=1173584 RepID=A0A1I0PD53_9RHOB|nr:hypothetical protein [Aliiroseovarius sediminilitoris]SEW12141.1 hypothetical protein SAMN05444851_1546 [Aliiroseovarius sediminilitoris]